MALLNSATDAERSRLVRKLQSIGDVTADEQLALMQVPMRIHALEKNVDIVQEGERPSNCCLLLSGFIVRYKGLSNGRRQILSFHSPGDIPDLQSLHLHTFDHNVATLVQSRVAFIKHDAIRNLIDRFPRLGCLFWRDTLIDAAIFREWMVGLGRRTAQPPRGAGRRRPERGYHCGC